MISKESGNNETTISYNNLSLPISYVNKVGNTVVNSFSYTYSVDGNRITDNDNVNNINKTYSYDSNGRLTSETVSGAENRTSAYTYDRRGNRVTETVTGDESYIRTNAYDSNNRLVSQIKETNGITENEINYYYDSNGNQTFKPQYNYSGKVEFGINAGDHTTGTVEEFTYNLHNQLIGYTNNDTSGGADIFLD